MMSLQKCIIISSNPKNLFILLDIFKLFMYYKSVIKKIISITYSELRRPVTDEVAATYSIRCFPRGVKDPSIRKNTNNGAFP